jgi:hypothetical protein
MQVRETNDTSGDERCGKSRDVGVPDFSRALSEQGSVNEEVQFKYKHDPAVPYVPEVTV